MMLSCFLFSLMVLFVQCVAYNGCADDRNVVILGQARFTMLTDFLIRLEWVPEDVSFENSPTLVILNRDLPKVDFSYSYVDEKTLVIKTKYLTVRYIDDGSSFHQQNLEITCFSLGTPVSWFPGMPDTGNLNGTLSSLDGITGPRPMDPGLLSRHGWTLVDDSATPLLVEQMGIPWISGDPRPDGIVDWYFFGYGNFYRQCLNDFALLSGPINMPPSSAFGIWWSEYYPFSESDVRYEIIGNYSSHGIPLNHYVLDMDWHTEPQNDPLCNGWNGYTWNEELFPDPMDFVNWMKAPPNNLKVLLNTHDDYGVDHCQACYAAFATAMGIDPATNQTVGCNLENITYYQNFFPIVLDPTGMDYDWTDFAGCGGQAFQSAYKLLWSNHVHDYYLSIQGKRPLVLSRNGGLGNHRYPVGFSGDVKIYWDSLKFETYFTPTAANVLFSYWSHDIGGFTDGMNADDESFLRWIQFAAFAPIFRTHSNHLERRIWTYPSYELMKEMFVLRNALHPYIYSAARNAFDTGISIVYPLYYDFPEHEMAYTYKHQYMFGTDFLISPIVSPVDNVTNTTMKNIWIPPGVWVKNSTLEFITGPQVLNNQKFGLNELGVYVRAGAIIPMKTMDSVTEEFPDPLLAVIYPGDIKGSTEVYNDAGDTLAYQYGEYSLTQLAYEKSYQSRTATVWLGPTAGSYPGMPQTRSYVVRLLQSSSPDQVSANGVLIPNTVTVPGWWLEDNVLVVALSVYSVTDTVELLVEYDQ